MSKVKKNIVLIAIGMVIIMLMMHKCNGLKHELKEMEHITDVLQDSVRIFKNKQGEWESEKKSFFVTKETLEDQITLLVGDQEKLTERVKNLNNLVAYYKGKVNSQGRGEVSLVPIEGADSIVYRDSIIYREYKFDWNNKYLTLKGEIGERKLTFDYSYEADFEVTSYWKRKNIFQRKDLVVNMNFSDPNAKVTDMNSVVIKPDPPKFYERTWFKVGIGVVGGFLIAK